MANRITYHAENDSMGNSTPEYCDAFRTWAKSEIEAEYPDHDVRVVNEPGARQTEVSSAGGWEREEDIQAFCKRLWERFDA